MPDLYLSENWEVVSVTIPIVIVFTIFSVITGRSYLKTKNIATFFLFGFNFSMMATFIPWSLRAIFYSADSASSMVQLLWRIAYMCGACALVFVMMFSLILIYGERIQRIHFVGALLLILFIVILITIAEIHPTTYVDVIDFQPVRLFQVLFLIIILSTLIIPNFILLKYLVRAERGTMAYNRVLFLELGLAVCTFGLLVDGTKFVENNWTLFLTRALIAFGGFLMLFGMIRSPKR